MSQYNPCSKCGYDSSAYLTAIEIRDELLETLKYTNVFISSRAKMHKDGIKLQREVIEKAESLQKKEH